VHVIWDRVRVMVFNATFNNISATVYRGGQFYWWRKPEYSKTYHKLLTNFSHIMVYRVYLAIPEIKITDLIGWLIIFYVHL